MSGGGFSGGGHVPPEAERERGKGSHASRFAKRVAKGWLRVVFHYAIVAPVVFGGLLLLLWALGITRF